MRDNYSNLTELFVDIVRQYPERIALKDSERWLTYLDMYRECCRVARVLKQHNVQPQDRVVCISKKNIESLVCFWGILLCEGIPVMLDEFDGIKANEEKIREVKAVAIILNKQSPMPETGSMLVLDFADFGTDSNNDDITVTAPQSDVCYILLTSGTTGKPKAVQISHGNVLHYTFSIYRKIGSPVNVNAVHASTFAADLGLTNLLVALVSGGMLCILNKEESTDPALFNEIIRRDNISLVKITPSHLLALVSNMKTGYNPPVEIIVLGGEKLSWETVKTIYSLGICKNLFNHYGPTETTIGVVAFKIEPSSEHFGVTGSVPLGAPLGNGYGFLDAAVENVGELCFTGPGVSLGYFENEPENNKKFFSREINGGMAWCYRTGDICKQLPDGNFEFLYRTDRQVKVKGYRIELGEIELMLAGHPDVESVIVCLSDNPNHTAIDAYLKLIKGRQQSSEQVRSWLMERLTAYKVPSNFYFYAKAPYNSNGKIDMNALKQQFRKDPVNAAEIIVDNNSWPELVEAAWKKTLNKNDIAATDNFFETGGDSLLAIQLVGKLQRHGYKVHITDLNVHPSLGDFISLWPLRQSTAQTSVAARKQASRFTFSQKTFLQQEAFDHDSYCQTVLLETESKIRVREMAIALNCVVESHPQLVTATRKKNGLYSREKRQFSGLDLGTLVLDVNKSVIAQIQDVCGLLLKDISIGAGNLFLAHVFIDPAGKDYLYLACHHLATDVISWNIIIDELLDFYEQASANNTPVISPENTIDQFFNALSQSEPATGDEDAYDRKIYKLPKIDAANAVKACAVSQLIIPKNISGALHEQDAVALMLSAVGNAVLQIFSLEKISIDMEFHGRPQQANVPDLSRSVGWWATTLPVNIAAGASFPKELVERAAKLANRLNLLNDHAQYLSTEHADIRFNYLGRFPATFGGSSIQMKPASFNPGPTRSEKAQQEYKLYFTARFIDDALVMDIQYQSRDFMKTTIDAICNLFLKLLAGYLGLEQPATISPLDSNLPSVGQPLFNINPKINSVATAKNILLTGATGFLGIHLLNVLSRTNKGNIYCLVRGESQGYAEHRLSTWYQHFFNELPAEQKDRIHVIKGDVASNGLGMSANDYDMLANEADLVLHAAADINLLKDYNELRNTNILGTKNIIELSRTGKQKDIHYISTLAVSGYSRDGIHRTFSEDDFDYGQVFISDYEKSKFEAEKMVREVLNQGLTGKIYRVGHIAADSVNGKFQRNIEQNRIFQVIKGMLLLKMVPETYNERISFSHVDIVSAAIAHFCMHDYNGQLQCIHVDNPRYIPFGTIAEMLQLLGYNIEVVEMETFRHAIANFEGLLNDRNAIDLMDSWIQRAIDFPRHTNYVHRRSVDLIGQAGLYFPALSLEWLSRMMKEGENAGYFTSQTLHKTSLHTSHQLV